MPRRSGLRRARTPGISLELLRVRVPIAVEPTGISRTTLHQLIKTGQLQVIKIGVATVIPVESLKMAVPAKTAFPCHMHPFPNAGYVMSGRLTIVDRATAAKRTFMAGQAFTESVGKVHRGFTGPAPNVVTMTYAGIPGEPTSSWRPARSRSIDNAGSAGLTIAGRHWDASVQLPNSIRQAPSRRSRSKRAKKVFRQHAGDVGSCREHDRRQIDAGARDEAVGPQWRRRLVVERRTKMNQLDSAGVDRLPGQPRVRVVSDELARIMTMVTDACSPEAKVSFAFDGRLHLLVDVRTIEEVVALELRLPGVGGGMFHEIQRSQAPRHGFGHRVTALVDR